jgi:signal transduction histidine kinase
VEHHEFARDRIAHDLKNQLGVILGFAAMLLTDFASDDPRRADMEEMHEAATVALRLVGELSSSGTPADRDEH